MATATFYDEVGRITGTLACSEISFAANVQDRNYIDGLYDNETYYVDVGAVKPRPIMPLVVVGSVITGIPQGSTVILNEQSFTVDDGTADIEGYTGIVKITCWPYLDADVEI